MELLGPAGFCVLNGEDIHHRTLELQNLLLAQGLTAVNLVEDGLDLGVGVVLSIELLDAVVAQLAAHRCEEVVTFLDCVDIVVEALDVHTAHLGQLVNVGLEVGWYLHGHSLVGTPGGKHAGLHRRVGSHLLVVLQ